MCNGALTTNKTLGKGTNKIQITMNRAPIDRNIFQKKNCTNFVFFLFNMNQLQIFQIKLDFINFLKNTYRGKTTFETNEEFIDFQFDGQRYLVFEFDGQKQILTIVDDKK